MGTKTFASLATAAALALAGCAGTQTSQTAAAPVSPTPGAAASSTPAPSADTVIYTVTSNAPLKTVSYTDGSANPGVDVASPGSSWTKTLTPAPGSLMVSLTASTGKLGDGSSITCKVTVNGVVKVQNTAESATICVASLKQ